MEQVQQRSSNSRLQASNSAEDSHTEEVENNNFNRIKLIHDEAYKHIDQAIIFEEGGENVKALEYYRKGLSLIDRALDNFCAETCEKNRQLHKKLVGARSEVVSRIEFLETRCSPNIASVYPSLYQDSMLYENSASAETSTVIPSAPSVDLVDSLSDSIIEDIDVMIHRTIVDPNASELFCISTGVQLFFINSHGHVSAPSCPGPLKIYKFAQNEENFQEKNPPAFLQVSDWVFPLVPNQSPVLRSSDGSYMFPDIGASQPDSYVGVKLPANIDPQCRQEFEELMDQLSALVIETIEPQPAEEEAIVIAAKEDHISDKVSRGLIIGAEWVAWGLTKGAEKTTKLFRYGSAKFRDHVAPDDQPVKVNSKYQTGLDYASSAAEVAVNVSRIIVDKLGEATVALGTYLAPHLREGAEKILPDSVKKPNASGKSTMDSVVTVVAGGVQGFGTVYVGLESAGKILAKSLHNETVTIVNHKYGSEAGKACDSAVRAAVNTGFTAYNISHLGVKALAKRAAKDTGKAAIRDYSEAHLDEPKTAKLSSSSAVTKN